MFPRNIKVTYIEASRTKTPRRPLWATQSLRPASVTPGQLAPLRQPKYYYPPVGPNIILLLALMNICHSHSLMMSLPPGAKLEQNDGGCTT